ncbi:caspase-10-like isoform X3 [Loxodonta africana]|uniref:caspase-10-like isoform X3 n=1 Tax=Loxodonta africana TaxID=9785 RepID=UPI000C813A32|nr:caspase-10-like isoform X3 [Loxodonta africana]
MTSQRQGLDTSLEENRRMDFRRKLLKINECLGAKDVEALKFLCRDWLSPKKLEKSGSALEIFEQLLAEEQLSEEDPFLLAELLFIIRQKSLLRHLRYSKEQVQSSLPAQRRVPLFRNLLYELSEDLDSENLRSMIFLLPNVFPKTEMSPSYTRKLRHCIKEKKSCLSVWAICRSMEPHRRSPGKMSMKEGVMEAAVYRMNRKHRGHCVIVNNHNFTSLTARLGTHKDAESLKCVFQWLGFTVRVYNNVKKVDLEKALQEYKSHPDHVDRDCFVCCILTHGNLGAVYSSDEALIPIREIMSQFTAQQCPGLAHKPKLFFIQACQGDEIQPSVSIEADALNPEKLPSAPRQVSLQDSIPVEADFLLGLATVPGYVSFRHPEKGSWYIQSLCNHLKDLVPRHEDILSILTAVNNDVSRQADKDGTKKQMPQPAFTLRKKLVFPVPQEAFSLQ